MRFYSEDQIARYEAPEGSWGYFYEAKDLTKHPFLDKYREELIERMRRDRSLTNTVNSVRLLSLIDNHDEYPQLFAMVFEFEVRNIISRGMAYWGNEILVDKIDEANLNLSDITRNFKWVILKYVQEKIRLIEDLRGVAADLIILEVAKKPKFRSYLDEGLFSVVYDINRYKTAADLFGRMHQVRDALSEPESKLSIEELEKLGELEIIYKDGKWIAFELKTARACADTGSGAWCTTRWAFDDYSSAGKLYTVKRKSSDTEMYHFHFERGEFTDENNSEIDSVQMDEMPLDKIFPWSFFANRNDPKKAAQHLINMVRGEHDLKEANWRVGKEIDRYDLGSEVVAAFAKERPDIALYFSEDYLMYNDEVVKATLTGREGPWPLIDYIKNNDDERVQTMMEDENFWSRAIERHGVMRSWSDDAQGHVLGWVWRGLIAEADENVAENHLFENYYGDIQYFHKKPSLDIQLAAVEGAFQQDGYQNQIMDMQRWLKWDWDSKAIELYESKMAS